MSDRERRRAARVGGRRCSRGRGVRRSARRPGRWSLLDSTGSPRTPRGCASRGAAESRRLARAVRRGTEARTWPPGPPADWATADDVPGAPRDRAGAAALEPLLAGCRGLRWPLATALAAAAASFDGPAAMTSTRTLAGAAWAGRLRDADRDAVPAAVGACARLDSPRHCGADLAARWTSRLLYDGDRRALRDRLQRRRRAARRAPTTTCSPPRRAWPASSRSPRATCRRALVPARPRADAGAGGAALISWSGTMFEYLMPLLVMRAYPRHAARRDLPRPSSRARSSTAGSAACPGASRSRPTTRVDPAELPVPGVRRARPGAEARPGRDLVVAPYATSWRCSSTPTAASPTCARSSDGAPTGATASTRRSTTRPTRLPRGARARGASARTWRTTRA